MSFASRFLFFKKLLKQPHLNASITPSSRFLARAMVQGIDFSHSKTIVEFGPGTGVFTREILRHTSKHTKIICIEFDKEYVDILHATYNNRVIIEHGSVHDIVFILKKHSVDRPDIIISGLPFTVYNENLVQQLNTYIHQGTVFRGFSYAPHHVHTVYHPLPLVQKGFVLRNVPPAFVFGAN